MINNKFFKLAISCFFTISLLLSCHSDDDNLHTDPPPEFQPEAGVFITNEGGFTHGNASLSFYNFNTKDVLNELFQTRNNQPLGDVLQSMTIDENRAFLVLNNSNKIEVINLESMGIEATIDTLISPRYFLKINDQKGYVTDLFSNNISIVDLTNYTITGSIPLDGWTEELLLWQGQVFVTNRNNSYLYIIDSQNDNLVDSIKIGHQPSTLQLDRNDQIWVLCSGDTDANAPGGIYKIDPANRQVTQTLSFADNSNLDWPRLRINGTRDTLYYTKGDVFQLPIQATTLPTTPLIPANGRILYGLGVSPVSGHVFVSDAIDFQQLGWAYEYQQNGTVLTSFQVGVIPNGFYF